MGDLLQMLRTRSVWLLPHYMNSHIRLLSLDLLIHFWHHDDVSVTFTRA